jgi:hypothetical protein
MTVVAAGKPDQITAVIDDRLVLRRLGSTGSQQDSKQQKKGAG